MRCGRVKQIVNFGDDLVKKWLGCMKRSKQLGADYSNDRLELGTLGRSQIDSSLESIFAICQRIIVCGDGMTLDVTVTDSLF